MRSKVSSKIQNILNFDLRYIKKELPSIVFIFVALLMGFLFIKNTGTLVGPDTYPAHYKASLAVATGQVFKHPTEVGYGRIHHIQGNEKYFSSGGKVCTEDTLVHLLVKTPLQPDKKSGCVRAHDKNLSSNKTVDTPAILQYPFISYMPQGIGLAIGMNIGMEPVDGQNLARLFNLITYILIVVVSIRLTTKGKWLIVLLASLPMSLFLASSLSADSLNIAWGFLFVSYIVHLFNRDKKIKRKQVIILASLSITLFLLKVAYAPLALLILALSNNVIPRRLRWLLFTFVATVGALLYLVWSSNWSSLNSQTDMGIQMSMILQHIPNFIVGIIINILYVPMQILQLNDSIFTFAAMIVILMLTHSISRTKIASPNNLFDFIYLYRLQILGLLVVFASLAVTYAALLLTWSDIAKYGWINIQGFQIRYVLPLLPLLLFAYYLPQDLRKKKNTDDI